MNDKNFIEELRQKREEYGVTQTRLALVTKTGCTNHKNGTGIRQRKSYNDTKRYD